MNLLLGFVCIANCFWFQAVQKITLCKLHYAVDYIEGNMSLTDQNGLFMIDSEMDVNKVIYGSFWYVNVSGENC